MQRRVNTPGRHGVIKMVSSFPTAATACTVYPPLTALRMHLGNFPQSLTRRTSMLALADDAALARLVIAAAHRRARLPPRNFPIARSRACPHGLE